MSTTCPDCPTLRARVAELESIVERLQARRVGRPGGGNDERSKLIAAACKTLGITRQMLAERLGVDNSRLSPNRRFAGEDHDRLMAELREMAGPLAAEEAKAQSKKRRRATPRR